MQYTLYKEEGADKGKSYRFSTADGALTKAKQEGWRNYSVYEGLRCITRVVSVGPPTKPAKVRPKPRKKKLVLKPRRKQS